MPSLTSSGSTVGLLIKAEADTGAITATTAELEKMGAASERSAVQSTASMEQFNKGLNTVGKQSAAVGRSMSTYITAPLVGIGYEAVKMATGFQKQMEYVRTQAGDTTDSIAGLSKQVLELSHHSAQGPEELAKGLFYLTSLGLRGASAMHALSVASQMASVGGANLEETTRALGAAMVTGIKGTEDLTKASGTLDATVGAGAMRMGDLISALGTGILPAAKNFGLSLTDVGAALALLTDNGMRADEAATRLKMSFSLMAAPSKKAGDIFNSMGMSVTQLGEDMQKPGGLSRAIKDLHDHMTKTFGADSTDQIKTYLGVLGKDGPDAADRFAASHEKAAYALSKAFGGGRSSAAIMTLLQQYDRLNNKTIQIGDQTNLMGDKIAATHKTASYQFHQAWSSIQADLVVLGDKLLPEVTKDFSQLSWWVQDVSKWYGGLSKGQKEFAIHTLEVVATMGPLLFVFGTLAKSISEIITLSRTAGIALGLIGAGSNVGGIAGAAGKLGLAARVGGGVAGAGEAAALAGGGEALAGGAAAAGGGLVAAVGGTALLPAAAVIGTAIGVAFAAEAVKTKFKQNDQASNTSLGLSKNSTLQEDAHTNHAKAIELVTKAEAARHKNDAIYHKALDQQIKDEGALDWAHGVLAIDQDKVTAARKRYGDGSPQVIKALQQENRDYDKMHSLQGQVHTDTQKLDAAKKTLGITTIGLSKAHDAYNQTIATMGTLSKAETEAEKLAKKAKDHVYEAQVAVNYAHRRFGDDSPQYHQATKNLTKAEQEYNDRKNTAKGLRDSLNNLENDAIGKRHGLTGKTNDLKDAQHRLNDALSKEPKNSLFEKLLNRGVSDINHWSADIWKHLAGHATGTNSARAGWSMVGEQGPEMMYLPQGAQIKTAAQTSAMMRGGNSNTSTVNIGTIVLSSQGAVTEFFKKIDQDTLLVHKGLTPNRGGA